MLYATTACTFSTCQLPKAIRKQIVLSFFTCKYASRHNGVHFFDSSTSKSGPNVRCFELFHLQMCFGPQQRATFHFSSDHMAPHPRFSEPTFRPSGATNHWKKHSESHLFCLFTRLHLLSSDSFSSLIFSLLLFSSLTLPISAFHLSILSEV